MIVHAEQYGVDDPSLLDDGKLVSGSVHIPYSIKIEEMKEQFAINGKDPKEVDEEIEGIRSRVQQMIAFGASVEEVASIIPPPHNKVAEGYAKVKESAQVPV